MNVGLFNQSAGEEGCLVECRDRQVWLGFGQADFEEQRGEYWVCLVVRGVGGHDLMHKFIIILHLRRNFMNQHASL